MRFAIATADKFDGVFGAFVEAGWTPLKLFTYSMDGRFQGSAVSATAERLGLPVQLTRITDADLADLGRQGCEALVVASYRWRVVDWRPHLRYGVNFHPSPLPQGRGPWPLVRAIRDGHRSWGVACHRLSPQFDDGGVLARETFLLAEDEDLESLDLRCQMGMRRLAVRVAAGLPALWDAAEPQDEAQATYFKRATPQERMLDLKGSVRDLKRQLRAFGSLECTAPLPGALVFVRRAVAWVEAHGQVPGALVHRNERQLVFALKDGYLGLLEWSLLPPEMDPRAAR